jgi:excinuclease ABC subunit B
VRFITRVADAREATEARQQEQEKRVADAAKAYSSDPAKLIEQLEKDMKEAAANLDFEAAARLRDQLFEIKAKADGNRSRARSSLAAIRVER